MIKIMGVYMEEGRLTYYEKEGMGWPTIEKKKERR